MWKPTKQLLFPTSLPQLPLGAQELKDKWHSLTPSGSTFFAAYLKRLAIETNHVESIFLLTEGARRLSLVVIHFLLSHCYCPVDTRLGPAWYFRGSGELSSRKRPTGHRRDQEHLERYIIGICFSSLH